MDTFFTARECEGRLKWLNLNLKDVLTGNKCIKFTTDPYCPHDFEMTAWTSSVTLSYGEIKTIHRNYSNYPNFQIDYNKVKTLQDNSANDNRRAYVVGFFDDDTIVWDITDIDFEERRYKQYCTTTTADYEKGKKPKEEIWLVKEEAIYPIKDKNKYE